MRLYPWEKVVLYILLSSVFLMSDRQNNEGASKGSLGKLCCQCVRSSTEVRTAGLACCFHLRDP
jgi:hypothetical protein